MRMDPVEIHVALLDENVDVWRPVLALHLEGTRYRILDPPLARALERWQFEPGEEVICEVIQLDGGEILAAVRKAAKGES